MADFAIARDGAEDLVARIEDGIRAIDLQMGRPATEFARPESRVLTSSLIVAVEDLCDAVEEELDQTRALDPFFELAIRESVGEARARLSRASSELAERVAALPAPRALPMSMLVVPAEPAGATAAADPARLEPLDGTPEERAESTAAQAVGRASVDTIVVSGIPPTNWAVLKRNCVVACLATAVAIAMFLGYLFIGSSLTGARSQRVLVGQFSQRVEAGDVDTVGAAPALGTPVAMIEMPSINQRAVVVEGSQAEQLKAGPGHVPGTPFPGEKGQSFIVGKRTTYGAPFWGINDLHPGDPIIVTTPAGRFEYAVMASRTVMPGDADIAAPEGAARLALISTEPRLWARGRIAVVAQLKGRAVGGTVTTNGDLNYRQMGLASEPVAFLFAALWALIFAVTILGSLILYKRWSRWAAYVLTMPVLLAVGLLLFESLDRLTPGAL